jgi:hypothetical protein
MEPKFSPIGRASDHVHAQPWQARAFRPGARRRQTATVGADVCLRECEVRLRVASASLGAVSADVPTEAPA